MIRVVEETEAKVTFNLTPSLIREIEECGKKETSDPFIELFLKDPEYMDPVEIKTMQFLYFKSLPSHTFEKYSRIKELYETFRAELPLKIEALRDLQVSFYLSWLSDIIKEEDREIKELIRKERLFNEEDKRFLLDRLRSYVKRLLGDYKRLSREGLIEISTSPFAHPILPLLIDNYVAKESDPWINLPSMRFEHPEDAYLQVREGIKTVFEIMGERPIGIWPPEGGVSDEALKILADCGIKWALTDEIILKRTDNTVSRYGPYDFNGLSLFFRNRELSDLIGFSYQHWIEEEAALDFISRLKSINENTNGGMLPIALDGENPWGYYEKSGIEFLRKVYSELNKASWGELSHFRENLRNISTLPHVSPGSWINGKFNKWIGNKEKNRVWDYLTNVRALYKDDPEKLPDDAKFSLMASEGSDTFWWLGPSREYDNVIFEELFRENLKNFCVSLGLEIPSEIEIPSTGSSVKVVRRIVAFMTPVIDGRDTDYFEWLSAAQFELTEPKVPKRYAYFKKFFLGVDQRNLYLRADFEGKATFILKKRFLEICFFNGEQKTFLIPAVKNDIDFAIDKILEVSIPLSFLGFNLGESFEISFSLKEGDKVVERFPPWGTMRISLPTEDDIKGEWMA